MESVQLLAPLLLHVLKPPLGLSWTSLDLIPSGSCCLCCLQAGRQGFLRSARACTGEFTRSCACRAASEHSASLHKLCKHLRCFSGSWLTAFTLKNAALKVKVNQGNLGRLRSSYINLHLLSGSVTWNCIRKSVFVYGHSFIEGDSL